MKPLTGARGVLAQSSLSLKLPKVVKKIFEKPCVEKKKKRKNGVYVCPPFCRRRDVGVDT
jgi:hypothetical protein